MQTYGRPARLSDISMFEKCRLPAFPTNAQCQCSHKRDPASDLLHDLLSSPISHHCVWSVITGHNLTPEKRDNNFTPHPLTQTACLPIVFILWHLSLFWVSVTYTLTRSSMNVSRVSATFLFHRRTRTAYVYNGCLACISYNVVLTSRIRSSVKYSQLGQSADICDVTNQPTRTLYMYKKSQ